MTTTDTTDRTPPPDVDEVDHGEELDVFDDAVDPRLRARWVAARRAEGRRRLYVLCGVVGTAAVLVIAYVIAHSSLLGAGSVEVQGVTGTGAAAVRAAARVPDGAPLLFLDEGAIARRVERLPTVARADVSTDLPSTVVIRVTERVPVAWTRSAAPTPPRVAVLDRDGRVLARTTAPPAGLVHVIGVGDPGVPGSRVAPARRRSARSPRCPRRCGPRWCDSSCVPRTARCSSWAAPTRWRARSSSERSTGSRRRPRRHWPCSTPCAARGTHVRVLGVQVPDAPFTRWMIAVGTGRSRRVGSRPQPEVDITLYLHPRSRVEGPPRRSTRCAGP